MCIPAAPLRVLTRKAPSAGYFFGYDPAARIRCMKLSKQALTVNEQIELEHVSAVSERVEREIQHIYLVSLGRAGPPTF